MRKSALKQIESKLLLSCIKKKGKKKNPTFYVDFFNLFFEIVTILNYFMTLGCMIALQVYITFKWRL